MKKFVLVAGAVFFVCGMFIQFFSSEAVLDIIETNASGKEFMYWLESILATVVLTIPGMKMMGNGLKDVETPSLPLFFFILFVFGASASLLRGMFAIYPHIGDNTGMMTFTSMIFSTSTQCFIAVFVCIPEEIRDSIFST